MRRLPARTVTVWVSREAPKERTIRTAPSSGPASVMSMLSTPVRVVTWRR